MKIGAVVGAGIQARSGAAGRTKLDQRQAHIIHRWYVEGWSVDEIVAETRLAVGHIYILKHRGLKKLREYCAEGIASGAERAVRLHSGRSLRPRT